MLCCVLCGYQQQVDKSLHTYMHVHHATVFICIRSVVPEGVLDSSPAIHLYDYFRHMILQVLHS